MNVSKRAKLEDRVEMRAKLRELARRLNRDVHEQACLRMPPVAQKVEHLLAALDDVIAALARDPLKVGENARLTDEADACPVCDYDPALCERGGNCALDPDARRRPEPWDVMTLMLPRPMMQTIKEAIERAREICAPGWRSNSAALALTTLEFCATHDLPFSNRSEANKLHFLVETFERAMGLRLVVSDKTGNLLYGIDNLAAMGGVDAPKQRSAVG